MTSFQYFSIIIICMCLVAYAINFAKNKNLEIDPVKFVYAD